MPETVIGAKLQDILHHQKTQEGSLTIVRNDHDIIANTIGHVLAIPSVHLPLLTGRAIGKNPTPELAKALFDRYKDVPWKGDVLVRVGHTSIMGDIQRLWAPYDKVKGKAIFSTTHWTIDRLARILYIPIQILKSVIAKIFRSDQYDPITNTAIVFHPYLGVGMHELGHAQFLEQQKKKEAWVFFYSTPGIRSFMEWHASKNAMKRFQNDTERRAALRLMEPAWASYVVGDLLSLVGADAIPPMKKTIGALVAGHLMNRYPKQSERFGYNRSLPPPEPNIVYGPLLLLCNPSYNKIFP